MLFKRKKKSEDQESEAEGAENVATAEEEPQEEPKAAAEQMTEEESNNNKDEGPKKGESPRAPRDRRKAASFFKHAATTAETRNYDYAIDLYISGLKNDPDNMDKHEELREVALRRKVAGGKPPKFSERFAVGAKEKIDKFLHAEKLWSKEPLSFARAINAMEKAVEADLDQDDYNIGEVVHWIGVLILEKNETDKQLKKEDYVKLKELFGEIGSWEKARDACARAIDLDPTDLSLSDELRDIEAEVTMIKSYDEKPEDDYRGNIKDADKQQELDQQDQLTKTERALTEIIERARNAYNENPDDIKLREKLISALISKHETESENEAIELLKEAHAKTENYRYKMQVSDVQMRQADRKLRKLQEAVKTNPDNAEAKTKLKQFYKQKLQFELQQFADRAKHYPTEMKWRYEIGKRYFAARKYEQAVEHLQKSMADPKVKSQSCNYLGQCYIASEWWDEAIDTLKSGLETHRDPSDKLGLEMRYNLMHALAKSAENDKVLERAKEAAKVASEILQANINYKDIKQRINEIRKLVKDLGKD